MIIILLLLKYIAIIFVFILSNNNNIKTIILKSMYTRMRIRSLNLLILKYKKFSYLKAR